MDLTQEQKDELRRIASNDHALGSFAGMLFNAIINKASSLNLDGIESAEDLGKLLALEAVNVRITVRNLAK